MEPLISLRKLTRTYQQGEQTVSALAGIDLDIGKGEFVAIMGPSGCGKSTLMHVLGFLLSPTGGEYRFEGRDTTSLSEVDRSVIRNEKIGFVFQSFNLLPRTSVLDNVLLPTEYAASIDLPKAKERALSLLAKVGLSHRVNAKTNQLSGGEQQRAAIARALINRPSLILADEPTGNLDSKTADDIMRIICDLNKEGNTIVMVTHEEDIARMAGRIVRIKDGRVVS